MGWASSKYVGQIAPLCLLAPLAMLSSACDRADSQAPGAQAPSPAASARPDDENSTASEAAVPDGQLAEGYFPIAFDLAGTGWLVTAIDGEPLADRYNDLATVHFTDAMLYWQGCNHHEGLYLQLPHSFAVGPAVATQAGCPPESPDPVMAGVLGSRPLIGRNREGKVMLATDKHTLSLSQIEVGYRDAPAPSVERAPFALLTGGSAGQRPVLSLVNNDLSVWMDCPGAIKGRFRISGGKLLTSNLDIADCPTHRPTARASLARFLRAQPRLALGPNGELLIGTQETLMHGRQCHPDASPCAHAAGGE